MNKSIVSGLILLVGISAWAEPEIKGTPAELSRYLKLTPERVLVTGEGEVRVPAHRAIVTLQVITENKSLLEAMRANQDLRARVADNLKASGIAPAGIQAAKFSSTPKFGMFSEKAKSYRVENEMRIAVQDEKELQAVAGAVDKWAEVQFGNVEFEYADKEQQKQDVIAKACDNVNERKKIYEEKLGLKLSPVKFDGGAQQLPAQDVVVQRYSTSSNSAIPRASDYNGYAGNAYAGNGANGELGASFGEIVYTARVTVEFNVQQN